MVLIALVEVTSKPQVLAVTLVMDPPSSVENVKVALLVEAVAEIRAVPPLPQKRSGVAVTVRIGPSV
jgi:hypothetical protein